MGRTAERIYTDQADIARLEALTEQLPGEAVVAITLVDGSLVEGVVAVRPIVQLFLDGDGNEGFNAVARIDDARDPARMHYLWVDRIAEIRRLGTD